MVRPRLITLDTGLQILILERPELHAAEIDLVVQAGPRFETRETNGLSHLLEHMLFRGTAAYPESRDFHWAVEALGGPLQGSTGRDTSLYSLMLGPRDVAEGLRLMAEATLRPTLAHLDLERKLVVEEMLEDVDEEGRDLNLEHLARRLLWPHDPLGLPIVGTRETVERFTVDDLRRWHERLYTTGNAMLIVAGAVDPAEVVEQARVCFADMRRAEALRCPPLRPVRPGPHVEHVDHDASQVELMLSIRAPGIRDPRAQGVALLQMILGDGVTSRLQWNICESRGLAYTIDVGYEPLTDVGVLDIDAAVTPENTTTLVREIVSTLVAIKQRGPTDEEVKRASRRYRLALEFALDSPAALASYHMDHLFGSRRSIEMRLQSLGGWDPARLRALTRRLLRRGQAVLATVGPLDTLSQRRIARLLHRL